MDARAKKDHIRDRIKCCVLSRTLKGSFRIMFTAGPPGRQVEVCKIKFAKLHGVGATYVNELVRSLKPGPDGTEQPIQNSEMDFSANKPPPSVRTIETMKEMATKYGYEISETTFSMAALPTTTIVLGLEGFLS